MSTDNTTLASFLKDRLNTGVPLLVEFNEGIEGLEGYAEKGMRATITGFDVMDNGETLRFYVDYSAFEDFNLAFETANYYGRDQQPTLTARQAGHYKPTEHFYANPKDSADTFFTPAEQTHELMTEWRNAGSNTSYVQFLEARVMELQAQLAPPAPRRGPTP